MPSLSEVQLQLCWGSSLAITVFYQVYVYALGSQNKISHTIKMLASPNKLNLYKHFMFDIYMYINFKFCDIDITDFDQSDEVISLGKVSSISKYHQYQNIIDIKISISKYH